VELLAHTRQARCLAGITQSAPWERA
jgi:hypothetical protein